MTIGIQNGRMVWAKVQSVSFHTTQQQHLFRGWSRMMTCMAALWLGLDTATELEEIRCGKSPTMRDQAIRA